MIKICNDRSVFPNSVKISNQYENDTRIIDFDLEDVQFTGNTYLICKYQNEDEYYAPLLLDSNNSIPVKTFLSQKAGMYECLIVISNVKIDENYDFSNDNPLFVSNLFNVCVSKNYLSGTSKKWELSPEMKNYYDRLIALVGKVQEDLDSGAFVGNGIKNITKTGSVGLVDTYQILFTNGSTFNFQVTNGATPTITIENAIWFVNGVSTGVSALGQKGDKGDPGVGIVSIEKTSTSGNVDTYTITFTNQTTSTFTVTNGTNGKDGVTPDIQIGTVTTLPAGSQATATITGTPEKPILNLGIPEGETGGTTNYNDLENKPQINGVELKGNKTSGDLKMYTQKEVDYMLADKMDKPYTSIEITDNATITDALEGNFKIDKIKGNTYQKVETDIVPTPQRPVPINSRKTIITKVNPNIFNLEKESDTSNIPDIGTYRSVGQYQLKANTKYIFEWTEATVPAKATLSFQIQDDKGTVLVSPFTYFNLETTEKKETGKQVEFTTNSSGIVKFAYNCTVGTSNNIETYQQYWYTKILKDISLKEDAEYTSERVELRSLKETSNLFDKNIMAFTSGALKKDGTVGTNVSYAVSGFVPVKPSTQYTIKVIDGFRNSTKVYYDINKQVISNDGITTFTTPSNCYFVRWQTATTDTIVLTEEDIQKINDEMMMVKGDSLPSSYVVPTVRDYKIVDHANKTAKIVRNVIYKSLNDLSYQIQSGQDGKNRIIVVYVYSIRPSGVDGAWNEIFVNNLPLIEYDGWADGLKDGVYYSHYGIYVLLNGVTTQEQYNDWLRLNPIYIQYQLSTPTEETIVYSADDVSEVGYSWQDTTSPSLTIPSQIEGVNEIDITVTGKNLVNEYDNFTQLKSGTYCLSTNKSNVKTRLDFGLYDENKELIRENIVSFVGSQFYLQLNGTYRLTNDANSIKSKITFHDERVKFIKIIYIDIYVKFDEIQLEVGDTATAYEPYTGQRVNITPTNPMYSTQDGSICDYVDVENGVEVYNMSGAVVLDGSDDEVWSVYSFKQGFSLYTPTFKGGTLLKGWCDKFIVKTSLGETTGIAMGLNNNYLYAMFVNDIATTVEEWRAWLSQNPITVVYLLATPTEIPIPEEDLAKIKSLKTNTGVNNIFINGEVKPSIEARYPKDLALVQQQLEQKILLISDSLIDTQAKVLLQGGINDVI